MKLDVEDNLGCRICVEVECMLEVMMDVGC